MIVAFVVVLLILCVAVVAALLYRSRRQASASEPIQNVLVEPTDPVERERAETVGSQLLARRVELDARRGALGGDAGIEEEFEGLLQKFAAHEISEEQFEREKIRLLGG